MGDEAQQRGGQLRAAGQPAVRGGLALPFEAVKGWLKGAVAELKREMETGVRIVVGEVRAGQVAMEQKMEGQQREAWEGATSNLLPPKLGGGAG